MRRLSSGSLATFLVAASLAALGMSVWTQVDQHESDIRRERYEACADGVLNHLVVVLSDSRTVAASERQVQRELFEAIRDDPRGFQPRIDAYLAALDAADTDRQARPLPLPPRAACGRPGG